jgi:hypothetical protein
MEKKSIAVLVLIVIGIGLFIAMTITPDKNAGQAPIQNTSSKPIVRTTMSDITGISRELPSNAKPGSVIEVRLGLKLGGASAVLIDDKVPETWTIISVDNGGSLIDTGHVKWAKLSGAQDGVFTYKVQVPLNAKGVYDFDGNYALGYVDSQGVDAKIFGNQDITIEYSK